MIEAIVYSSKCGHTLAYAKELAGRLNLPYYSLKKAKKYLKNQDTVTPLKITNPTVMASIENELD